MILNFCATFLSRLFPPDQQSQHALTWWHQRQVDRLHDSAELIRDGLLQELFAIRRGLELASDEDGLDTQASLQDGLRQLEALHLQLETVSNLLSPAFVQDSFPLAVQYSLKAWGQRHPAITLTTQLSHRKTAPDFSSRITLTSLEELLRLTSDNLEAGTEITINSNDEELSSSLTVQIKNLTCDRIRSIAQIEELRHLQKSFEFLTGGLMQQQADDRQIRWEFVWPMRDRAPD
ncbi:MAG: hypothetical protein WBA10_07020 [Elainellaceae cyanobacterium]